jgi:integrase
MGFRSKLLDRFSIGATFSAEGGMGSIVDRRLRSGKKRRYIVFKDLDGRQTWVTCPDGMTMAKAKAQLAAAETNVANGKVGIAPRPKPEEVRARRITLRELIDRFCAEYTNPKVKDLARYRAEAKSSLGTHVKQHRIASLPAVEVTKQRVEDLRDEALAPKEGKRAPAAATIKFALALLSRVYNWANDRGLIDCKNPVSKVAKPVKHSTDDFDYLSADEVARLLAWAERNQPNEFPFYATAVYTGMRLGELCGLRWTDVDLEMRHILVRRSYRATPKRGKSRKITLSPHLAPILRAWKERCRRTEEGLVFPAPLPEERGKLTREQVVELRTRGSAGERPATLAKAYGLSWTGAKKIIAGTSWKTDKPRVEMRDKDGDLGFHAALDAAGCHRVRFHDLRHTFASHFMMSGGNILALQKLLDHHDVKVTQKYEHLAPDYLAAEAARVSFQPNAKAAGKIVALSDRAQSLQSE